MNFKLTPFAEHMLRDRYMTADDKTPQDVFTRAVVSVTANIPELRKRMLAYVSAGWFIPSTPVLANAGTGRGNSIACFLQSVQDSRSCKSGLMDAMNSLCWMSSEGGGVGSDWSKVRSQGAKTSKGSQSNGVLPFISMNDRAVLAYAQGGTRRASSAEFLDASHPEIEEFIEMRKPTGGDINRKNLNLHHGVKLSDNFMDAVLHDDWWHLTDPSGYKGAIKVRKAREIFEQIIEARAFQGEPYMVFTDNMTKHRPLTLELLNVYPDTTNLCTEITVATYMPDGEPSVGVCCLGSINLEKWEEFTHADVDFDLFIRDCLHYLWLNLDGFIRSDFPVQAARDNAAYYRDVGLGMLGFHSFLQSKGVAFDSVMGKSWNNRLFSTLGKSIKKANKDLASIVGICPAAHDAGLELAFTHTTAIAPNASTSILTNTSAGIEPLAGNAFTRETASGTQMWRNPHLERLLTDLGKNDEYTWTSIAVNHGSVQHLDFLDDHAKAVYKTAYEINPLVVIDLAADRQPYIDQAQSINLFFAPETEREFALAVHIAAWKKGIKTLYYYRSMPQHKASTGMKHNAVVQDTSTDCLHCAN